MDIVRSKKKILVLFSSELVPVTMMNQNRTVTMINRLSADHDVDLLTADTNNRELLFKVMPELTNIYFFKHHRNFGIVRKAFFYVITCLLTCILMFPEHYHTIINRSLKLKFKKLLNGSEYKIVLMHYWYLKKILPKKRGNYSVIIDTHGLIFQKVQLEANQQKGFISKKLDNIYASIYKKKELNALNQADILLFNSYQDEQEYATKLHGKIKSFTISNGQDYDYFKGYDNSKAHNTILFYGSLGGIQNQQAFQILWNEIFPAIQLRIKDVRLIVMGNNPPKWISELQSEKVIVTGYVEDIRTYLSESNVCLLPLSIGSGFRGRVVELMAMGVPVVGTHNALDSVNLEQGKHGYITDDKDEMIEFVIKILADKVFNKKLSENCKQFVQDTYTIESTYGKLSSLLQSL